MFAKTTCPHCHAECTVPDAQRGIKLRCQRCQGVFIVPAPRPDPLPVPPKKAPPSSAVRQGPGPPRQPLPGSISRLPQTSPQPMSDAEKQRKIAAILKDELAAAHKKSWLPLVVFAFLGALLILTGGYVAVVALNRLEQDKPIAAGRKDTAPPAKGASEQELADARGKGPKQKKHLGVKEPDWIRDDLPKKEALPKKAELEDPQPEPRPERLKDPESPEDSEPDKKRGPKKDPASEKKKEAPSKKMGKEEAVVVRDGQLPKAILERVKEATAYLRVTLPSQSVAQGSGFLAVRPGLVLTNAHVLGMLHADSRRPARVDVVLLSGTQRERAFTGEILGVDRSTDLAVVRIAGDNLPRPLQVKSARGLSETQSVYVFGFPLGVQLGKNISIRRSSVSSLRTDAFGVLEKVQVEGGMDPGNSGGPVVDGEGNVIGVAVSKIMNTQLNFAVPGDFVEVILNGRLATFAIDQPFKNGSDITVQVRAEFLDPLKKVRNVSLAYWTGDPGKHRPPSSKPPVPEAGDSAHQMVELAYQDGKASGEFHLPPLLAGKVYWTRPVYENGAGERKWVAASPYQPLPPLERKPALLVLKQHLGHRSLRLGSTAKIKLVDADGDEHKLHIRLGVDFVENTLKVNAQGLTGILLQYADLRLAYQIDGQAARPSARVQEALLHGKLMATHLIVDRSGKLVRKQVDLTRVPVASREKLNDLHEQIEASLDAVFIPLPNKQVQAGEKWTLRRHLIMATQDRHENAVLELTCTYVGTRHRDGRDEALIRLEGGVKGGRGQEKKLGGRAKGTALLDLASGQISDAAVTVGMDLDTMFGKRDAKATATLEVRLKRASAGKR
jgi:S1-C subfamily serine protease